jgi:predicted Rossmann fold nucleotide-binding protein DprA/Smf involved in DNA uptake
LCLVTPFSPNAGFSIGAAMGRNRLIYCLADYAIVVASDAESGGTWAGATEALKNN